MRDIAPGEELTHDWATTDDLDYEMECHCGAVGCRGTVTSKDWMKEELQQKYAGWFCWFLQRKIDALAARHRKTPAEPFRSTNAITPARTLCGTTFSRLL